MEENTVKCYMAECEPVDLALNSISEVHSIARLLVDDPQCFCFIWNKPNDPLSFLSGRMVYIPSRKIAAVCSLANDVVRWVAGESAQECAEKYLRFYVG